MNNISILIVEDEKAINDLIKMNLEFEGYNCTCAYDGLAAADILDENSFDLVLLDIMLPGADGYELLDCIRPRNIPVIFLTAKAMLADRIKGLELGAEDYIIKPFEISELLARVKVVLRRYNKSDSILKFSDLVIDTSLRTIKKNNVEIRLTPKELDLIIYLIRNKNIIISKYTLYENVWNEEYDDESRTLELHIQRLRKKVGLKDNLKTMYGYGYKLED